MISAHIIDDHPVSRWGLQQALQSVPDITVTAMYASAAEVRADRGRSAPDIVLLDLYLDDDLPCVELVTELAGSAVVMVMSASRRGADIERCRQAGARGFVHKSSDEATIVAAVRAAVDGRSSFPGLDPNATDALAELSPRERQVLAYIAGGYTHDQTARRLGLSRHTVDTYLKRLRAKIGVGNKAHLTRVALAAGVPLDAPGRS